MERLKILVKLKPLKITLELDQFQEYKMRMKNLSKYMVLEHIIRYTLGAKNLVIWAGSSLYIYFS